MVKYLLEEDIKEQSGEANLSELESLEILFFSFDEIHNLSKCTLLKYITCLALHLNP